MISKDDELLFVQIMKKLGLDIHEGKVDFNINGISADKYLEKHNIMEVPESNFVQVCFSAEEEYQDELFDGRENNLRNAA